MKQSRLQQAAADKAEAAAAAAAAAGQDSDWEGVEDGMVTPASHLSSEQCTPTIQGMERRPGAEAAAAAGSAEAADSLAPAEVRQRILSDAAAELLHDQLTDEQRVELLAGCSPAAAAAERTQGGLVGEAAAAAAAGKPSDPDALLDGAMSADDPMVNLYRAARNATLHLHHQSSDVTVGQFSPRTGRSRRSAQSEEEGFADTPATPSTGGFSFMLPGGASPAQGVPAGTPGLLGSDVGGARLPPGTAAGDQQRRYSQIDPHPHTGLRLSGALLPLLLSLHLPALPRLLQRSRGFISRPTNQCGCPFPPPSLPACLQLRGGCQSRRSGGAPCTPPALAAQPSPAPAAPRAPPPVAGAPRPSQLAAAAVATPFSTGESLSWWLRICWVVGMTMLTWRWSRCCRRPTPCPQTSTWAHGEHSSPSHPLCAPAGLLHAVNNRGCCLL